MVDNSMVIDSSHGFEDTRVSCKDCDLLKHNSLDYTIISCKPYRIIGKDSPIEGYYTEREYDKYKIHPTMRNSHYNCRWFKKKRSLLRKIIDLF